MGILDRCLKSTLLFNQRLYGVADIFCPLYYLATRKYDLGTLQRRATVHNLLVLKSRNDKADDAPT